MKKKVIGIIAAIHRSLLIRREPEHEESGHAGERGRCK